MSEESKTEEAKKACEKTPVTSSEAEETAI